MDEQLNLERIANVILSKSPDIVCMQEVDSGQPRSLMKDFPVLFSELLGMQQAFGDNFHFDGGKYGNAIFTHFPMDYIDNLALSVNAGAEPRGCLHVRVETSDGLLDVFNTHLSYNDSPRLIQAKEITRVLPHTNTILAGDLNDSANSPILTHLYSILKDSFIPEADDTGYTFPSNEPECRIDYILVSDDIRVISSGKLNTYESQLASDHLPWYSDIELG